jgi:hypothetical protein
MATQDFDRIFLFTLADLDDPRVGPRDKLWGDENYGTRDEPGQSGLRWDKTHGGSTT